MKILIASPDAEEQQFLNKALKEEGFSVESSKTYNRISEKISLFEYDCILLSTTFEHNKSSDLLKEIIVQNKNEGIIIIASNEILEEKIKALKEGADDYIVLPVHPEELSARIYALIRRKKFQTRTNVYFGNLVINLHERGIFVWDKPVAFTKKELDILLYLISNKNKVVKKETLSEYLWSEDSGTPDSDNTLIAHIKNIRKKLVQSKAEIEIKNIYGIGYQIIEL